MTATPLRFQQGDTLSIRNEQGQVALWSVIDRKRRGYLLQPHGGGDARTWSDDEIDTVYGARRLTHHPCNAEGLPKAIAEALEKTWEFWPEEVRREAERRETYVRMVDAVRNQHPTLMGAYAAAAETVFDAHHDQWRREDTEFAARLDAEWRRSPSSASRRSKILNRPNPYTVRAWYGVWSRHGRDIRLLIPHYHRRGARQARYAREDGDRPDTYKLMRQAVEAWYLGMPRRRKNYAYRRYVDLCCEQGVPAVSDRTFRVFIRDNYTERQEYERRFGRRAAWLKFGIFERRNPPERPLEEVEVDHCLIDLVVVHAESGRPLGRPWLTALIDRATRMIVGAHLSFEAPSYASLQRAVGHALWKKDLSGVDDIDRDWPCHGVPEWLICDNGKEFRSQSLQTSGRMLDIGIVNLPVKMPWLKGAIERVFQTIGVQVFSHEEGTTLSRTLDLYDPVARARLSLEEVRQRILKWIVDDYHHHVHDTLRCTPYERWRELTELYPVRPVPDFDHIVRLTGETFFRRISNIGIQYEGLLYADRGKLEPLLARRGGLEKDWEIRYDPYDLGEIWLLDDDRGEWLMIPCVDQSVSRGISKYQHKIHRALARRSLPKDAPVTIADLEASRALAEQTADELQTTKSKVRSAVRAARYEADGSYFTPLEGQPPMPVREPQAPAVDKAPPKQDVAPTPPPAIDLDADIAALVAQWSEPKR
ncbi:Mu transposase C-terminal domain-containing protein [Sphingobium sp. MK2]|uniref:Mu transposase C-terminal domain-containing protein n=1 Tax=Sphingobium sp. MK2 TaxID=3116540 RepID=UPI0032E358AA